MSQTLEVVIGAGGRTEILETEFAPGTRVEVTIKPSLDKDDWSHHWAASDRLTAEGMEAWSLVSLDALHAAAAIRAGAHRFVTTERPGKPRYRLAEVQVTHLLDL